MEKKVKIYSTPSCPYCHRAKAYMDEKGISYEDIDVSENPEKGEEMVAITGQMSVPVIVIDGEVIIGFDRQRLDRLLA